jgi:hypothetical protein
MMFRTGGRIQAPPPITPSPIASAVCLVIGIVIFIIGLGAYGIVIASRCFTFNFNRPIYKALKGKMWFANLLVSLLLQGGFAFMVMPMLLHGLNGLLPDTLLFPVSLFIPFIVAQIVMIWFTLWAPIETGIIRERLKAHGITPEQFANGRYMGVSDPTRSSFKKLTQVEDDIGMLWLAPDRLIYRGDVQHFDIPHANVLDIERKADAGSTSSYFGGVHVIVRYRDSDGIEKRVRLHPEGDWTMTGKARAQNALAEALEMWRSSAPATIAPAAADAAASA